MATIIAAAGGGNWTAGGTWIGGVAPAAGDDAVLQAASGNITVDAGAVCRSLDCTSGTGTYANTLTFTASTDLTIGTTTAGAGNVALKLRGAIAGVAAGNSRFVFVSTSTTVQTVDSGGLTVGGAVFNGTGGKWQLSAAFTTNSNSSVTLTAGTLDTNGQTCSWGSFSSNVATTRTLTLGASSITITAANWNCGTTTNMTVNANTSTITLSAASAQFINGNGVGGGRTWNNLVLNGIGAQRITSGASSIFNNVTRTGAALKTDSLEVVSNGITVNGTFTCNGNSATNRMFVNTVTAGGTMTITAAAVSVTNSDFMDITGAGAGSWNLAAVTGGSGDCGGNSGITFTTPATQTATGTASFTWSTHGWTSRVPLPQDDVVINNSFVAGRTITADMPRSGKNVDLSGATGSPALAITATNWDIFGALTLHTAGTVSSGNTLRLRGRSSYTVTTNGRSVGCAVTVAASGGTYTLADTYTSTAGLFALNGTFLTNNFNITCLTFTGSGSLTRTITLGTSTITLTSTATVNILDMATTGITFSGASSTFVVGTSSANSRQIAGAGITYGTLTYTVAGSTGALTMTGNNTWSTINFSNATGTRTLTLTGTTQTVTNINGIFGSAAGNMSITGGTFSKASGIVSCNYLTLTSQTASGGATFYAGANSADSGGNSGWIFTAAPASVTNKFLPLLGVG